MTEAGSGAARGPCFTWQFFRGGNTGNWDLCYSNTLCFCLCLLFADLEPLHVGLNLLSCIRQRLLILDLVACDP